mgnify:CR=1 FL=1
MDKGRGGWIEWERPIMSGWWRCVLAVCKDCTSSPRSSVTKRVDEEWGFMWKACGESSAGKQGQRMVGGSLRRSEVEANRLSGSVVRGLADEGIGGMLERQRLMQADP